jgi:hypothetical protein
LMWLVAMGRCACLCVMCMRDCVRGCVARARRCCAGLHTRCVLESPFPLGFMRCTFAIRLRELYVHVHDAPRRRRARSYLTKVGAPLALNMYTAVHNNISLEGRQAVCAGVLSNVDLRPKMKHLPMPLIVVASSQARARGPLVSRAFRSIMAPARRTVS